MLLRCGEQVVIFEVKLSQNHSAGQWRDQMSVVLRRFGCPPKYLRYVAVGGHDSHNDQARVSALGQGLSEVGVFRLQWAELASSLLATRQRPRPQVLERGVRSMLGDAVRALELVGHPPRRDLITLKRLALANESLDVMRDWTPTHEQLR